jgi:hypothetical protein
VDRITISDAMKPKTLRLWQTRVNCASEFKPAPCKVVYLDGLWPRVSARFRALMNTNWINEYIGPGGNAKVAALERFITERDRLESDEDRRALATAVASRVLSCFSTDGNSLFMFVHDVEVAALLRIKTASEFSEALRREVGFLARPYHDTEVAAPAHESAARRLLDRDHVAAAMLILEAHKLI